MAEPSGVEDEPFARALDERARDGHGGAVQACDDFTGSQNVQPSPIVVR